jgi:transcriptional regulator with XRE-family HTH domain
MNGTDERQQAEDASDGLKSVQDDRPDQWPPVAARIRKARESLGLTEADIAGRLGIAPSDYWDVELHNEEAFVATSLAALSQIADILSIPLHVLLFGPTTKAPASRATFVEIAGRLAALATSEGLSIAEFGERIGWELEPVVASPESLSGFNIVGLRDVCNAVGVDWVEALSTWNRDRITKR